MLFGGSWGLRPWPTRVSILFFIGYQELTNQAQQGKRIAKMAFGNPFTFPEAWHTVAYFSSLICIYSCCDDHHVHYVMNIRFKTHRQNIIDGWSRNQFMSSKLIDVGIIIVAHRSNVFHLFVS